MPNVNENRDGTPDDDWVDWLRDWLVSLEARGLARSSLTVYRRTLAQFRKHLAAEYPEAAGPEDVTRRHVESFLAALAGAGMSSSTRRVRLMTLKAFFGWLVAEPGTTLAVNPTVGIEAPVAELPPVPVIADDVLKAVLATCSNGSFVDLRDAAIIRVLVACGLRREELCRLDVGDVDLNHGVLTVLGKGNKTRLVSIGGSRTTLALSRYLRVRRRHPGAKENTFFLATRADRAGSYRLRGGGVAMMVNRRCAAAGVPEFHPHQLRHTWAHVNKQAGLSDEDLERMAGWSSPMMVRRYGRALADERARDAHARLATGDRL
jgi:site-specific recombinase XerD